MDVFNHMKLCQTHASSALLKAKNYGCSTSMRVTAMVALFFCRRFYKNNGILIALCRIFGVASTMDAFFLLAVLYFHNYNVVKQIIIIAEAVMYGCTGFFNFLLFVILYRFVIERIATTHRKEVLRCQYCSYNHLRTIGKGNKK